MVVGGIGAGIAQPGQFRERFSRRHLRAVQEAVEGVGAKGVLPRGGSTFLVLRAGTTIVASMSSTCSWLRSGVAPAAQAVSLVLARPMRRPGRWASETLSSTRQAVGVDARAPKSWASGLSTFMSNIDIAPSATEAARSTSTSAKHLPASRSSPPQFSH